MGVIHHISDRVIVMTEGRIVEEGPVDQVFLDPQHDYTKLLLKALPKLPGRADRPKREPSMSDYANDIQVWREQRSPH